MTKLLIISNKHILHQVKISCQVNQIIEIIAIHKIINEAADKVGIKIDKEELQQAIDSVRAANKLVKADDTWTWLQKHYLSLEDFKELAQINLVSTKLANHLFAKEVELFFLSHQLDYVAAVTYEVVLDNEDLAWKLFEQLKENNITFSNVAHQYIKETELRRVGGYCGVKYRRNFSPEIAACVFAAHPPQILKPIITQKGIHLIYVEEFVQPQLDEQLYSNILGQLFSDWLKQQLEEIQIINQIQWKKY